VITLDGSGGSAIPSGGLSVDGAAGDNTLRLVGGQSDLDFTGDGNVTAGNLSRIELADNGNDNDENDNGAQQITVDAASIAALMMVCS